jgi:hypothetical protein
MESPAGFVQVYPVKSQTAYHISILQSWKVWPKAAIYHKVIGSN